MTLNQTIDISQARGLMKRQIREANLQAERRVLRLSKKYPTSRRRHFRQMVQVYTQCFGQFYVKNLPVKDLTTQIVTFFPSDEHEGFQHEYTLLDASGSKPHVEDRIFNSVLVSDHTYHRLVQDGCKSVGAVGKKLWDQAWFVLTRPQAGEELPKGKFYVCTPEGVVPVGRDIPDVCRFKTWIAADDIEEGSMSGRALNKYRQAETTDPAIVRLFRRQL